MDEPAKRKFLRSLTIIIVFAVIVSGVVLAHSLTTATEDLDVNRGLLREQTFFAGCLMHESFEETPVSIELADETQLHPEWKRVTDVEGFLLGHHSVNMGDSSNVKATRKIGELWSEGQFTPDARHRSALALMACIRENPLRTQSYLRRLRKLLEGRQGDNSQPIDVGDLPDVPTKP
jgi:hypothetical protein